MGNVFDQFDQTAPKQAGGNVFDQFDQGAQPTQKGLGQYWWETAKNLPGSVFNVLLNTAKSMNPIPSDMSSISGAVTSSPLVNTAKDMLMTALGRPEEVNKIGNAYANRYGGWENIAKTVHDNPAVVLQDLSPVLNLGGRVASKIADVADMPTVANIANKVSNVGQRIDPINLTLQAGKLPFKLIPSSVPERIYAAALKQSGPNISPEDMLTTTKEGLQERVPVGNMGGVEQVSQRISNFNDAIRSLLEQAQQQGVNVPLNPILNKIGEVPQMYKGLLDPAEYQRVLDTANEMKNRISSNKGTAIPIMDAQIAKQNLYKLHENDYRLNREVDPVKVALDKAQASGLRQGIEQSMMPREGIPVTSGLNEQVGTPIDNRLKNSGILPEEVQTPASVVSQNPSLNQVIGKVQGEPLAYGDVPREPANFYQGTIPETSYAPGAIKPDQTVYLQKPQMNIEQTPPMPLIQRDAGYAKSSSTRDMAALDILKNEKGNIPLITDAANYIKSKIKKEVTPEDITNQILQEYPDIHSLNAKEARLIDLRGAVESAYKRIQKHNPLQLQDMVIGGGIGAATRSVEGFLLGVVTHHILAMPEVSSRIAFMMNSAKTQPFVPRNTLPSQTFGRMGAINNE